MIDTLREIDAWLRANDPIIDLVTVWTLAVTGMVLGLVKIVSWWALRQTHDQTDVGTSLKLQKASEGPAWIAMASLYGLSLVGYYTGHRFGFYDRFSIRVVLFVTAVIAAIMGIRFVVALRRETRAPWDGGEA